MVEISLKAKAAIYCWLEGFCVEDEMVALMEKAAEDTNFFGAGSYDALMAIVEEDENYVPEFEEYRQFINELGFEGIIDDATIEFGRAMLLDCAEDGGDIMLEIQGDGSIEAFRNSTGEVFQ